MSDLSFGQPELQDYKPGVTVRDPKSPNSRTKRIKGYKTGRVHHLLSDFESKYFYILEWADNVSDIREQFTLNFDETTSIAKSLGVSHSKFDGQLVTMTTDFVISINSKYVIARTLKFSNELEDERILEKFCIEQEYWRSKGVDWGIVTEKEIDELFVRNIRHFIRHRKNIDSLGVSKAIVRQIIAEISAGNCSLKSVLYESDIVHDLEKGTSLAIFNDLVGNKVLGVNMWKKPSVNMPCSEIEVSGAV